MGVAEIAKRMDESSGAHSSEFKKPHKYHVAPNGKRVVAFLIDAVISGAIGKGIVAIFASVLNFHSTTFAVLISVAISFVYWVVQAVEFKGTPGKKMMNLRIVTSADSRQLTYGQMALREIIGRPLSMIPLFAGYFWAFFAKDHRAWHDKIGKTRVVEYP